MNIKYACAKPNCSKRIPAKGPGQSSGVESSTREFTDEFYKMHVAAGLLIVKPLVKQTRFGEGMEPFAYPLSDFEFLIPAEEAQGKR